MNANATAECCPQFNPAPWDGKQITWSQRKFIKDRVTSFFHIPLNYGAVMARNLAAIEEAGALAKPRLILTDENSLWGADVYFEVVREVPSRNLAFISGTFLSKVFEGPFSNVKRWVSEMSEYAKTQGKAVEKLYFFYTTCPKCAKKYGKNHVVLLAQI
jgi:hypothetical protein